MSDAGLKRLGETKVELLTNRGLVSCCSALCNIVKAYTKVKFGEKINLALDSLS